MLKYLDNSEKDKTREIWEIIFKEDTKEFIRLIEKTNNYFKKERKVKK